MERAFLPLVGGGKWGRFFFFFFFGWLTNAASGVMTNPTPALGHFENMNITLRQNTSRRTATLLLLSQGVDTTAAAFRVARRHPFVQNTQNWPTLGNVKERNMKVAEWLSGIVTQRL